VLELPSLWSMLTNWGVRVAFTADFLRPNASTRRASIAYAG